MIHQLRIYEIFEANKAAFHARFRDHAARIMRKYDFHILALWESSHAGRTELVYLLEWPDERTKNAAWAKFMADEEWAAIKRETHLDGKWLLRTSDTTLTPDDLAAAYKQLLQVERGWRDFKGALGLRPVFHYREDRIRAHIQLCWLALLLLRVIENATGDTWRNTRRELDRMHLVTLATNAGQVAQRSATNPGQQTVLRALDLPEPPKFFDFTVLPESD